MQTGIEVKFKSIVVLSEATRLWSNEVRAGAEVVRTEAYLVKSQML